MCLAIPARVVAAGPGSKGRIDYLGTKISADLSLLTDVRVGDWVIVHAGFAISKLDETEARQTLDMLREMVEPSPPEAGPAAAKRASKRRP